MRDPIEFLEQAVGSEGPDAALDLLARRFREEKNYPLLFEARLMRKRRELGLPALMTSSLNDLPEEQRAPYEQAFMDAAREVGSLYLGDGDVQRAWPYFRAVGDRAPVAQAIEKLDPQDERVEGVLPIALEEGVHPRKGFELLLARYGICRAITFFEQYPDPGTRGDCLALLVRSLHAELLENLRRAVAQREGAAPATHNISDLIAGRPWLFGDLDAYVDTSHLISVIRFALDLSDPELIGRALELCDYGAHLSPQFSYRVDPPFEDVYRDHAMYLRALAGQDVDAAIAHFRNKLSGSGPAQVLVGLLARLGRFQEAIEISLEHLSDCVPEQLACPSVLQLCQMAGDYQRMREIARERGDVLGFAAAVVSE